MILERNAPAKVNLGLHVLQKRTDGYHDIETVFMPIAWYDQLRVAPASTLTFTCSDARLPVDASNLCLRAANLLMKHVDQTLTANVHLEKEIPFGAGLGGGSSDAAATLRMLDELWNLRLDNATLHALAVALGADVPFFLEQEVMFASGLGEQLTPLLDADGNIYQFPFEIIIAVPQVHVSTVDAYGMITPQAHGRPDLRKIVTSNDLSQWRSFLVNDFETPVFKAHPMIEQVKNRMIAAGAGYASMSGSGSAVFGVFEDSEAVETAAGKLADLEVQLWWNKENRKHQCRKHQ